MLLSDPSWLLVIMSCLALADQQLTSWQTVVTAALGMVFAACVGKGLSPNDCVRHVNAGYYCSPISYSIPLSGVNRISLWGKFNSWLSALILLISMHSLIFNLGAFFEILVESFQTDGIFSKSSSCCYDLQWSILFLLTYESFSKSKLLCILFRLIDGLFSWGVKSKEEQIAEIQVCKCCMLNHP